MFGFHNCVSRKGTRSAVRACGGAGVSIQVRGKAKLVVPHGPATAVDPALCRSREGRIGIGSHYRVTTVLPRASPIEQLMVLGKVSQRLLLPSDSGVDGHAGCLCAATHRLGPGEWLEMGEVDGRSEEAPVN